MKDLSPAAQAMVDEYRRRDALTRADRDRIKRGVLLQAMTVGAATVTTGTAAGMSVAAKITLMAVAATVVGGGAVSVWALRARTATPTAIVRTPPLPSAPTLPAPAPAETPEPAPVASVEQPRTSGGKKASKRHAAESDSMSAGATAAPELPADPEPELRVLRQAREDLRAGRTEDAYRRLAEYERERPKGALAQERQALAAIALCRWRPGPAAHLRATEFLQSSPDSPLAHRVHSVCEKSATPSK